MARLDVFVPIQRRGVLLEPVPLPGDRRHLHANWYPSAWAFPNARPTYGAANEVRGPKGPIVLACFGLSEIPVVVFDGTIPSLSIGCMACRSIYVDINFDPVFSGQRIRS